MKRATNRIGRRLGWRGWTSLLGYVFLMGMLASLIESADWIIQDTHAQSSYLFFGATEQGQQPSGDFCATVQVSFEGTKEE